LYKKYKKYDIIYI